MEELKRLEKLMDVLEYDFEADYGYVPSFKIVNENCVDLYIHKVKNEMKEKISRGEILDSLNENSEGIQSYQFESVLDEI